MAKTPLGHNKYNYSGSYGDLSLAVEQKDVTGVYEYYDNWDPKAKEFLDINVFYFKGNLVNDSTAIITTSWPGEDQILSGTIRFNNSISNSRSILIKLNEQPNGYSNVDFTQPSGVKMELTQQKDWLEIRLVASERCATYDKPDIKSKRKSYIIKNDVVKIVKVEGDFVQIEYDGKNATAFYWIKSSDLR